MISNLYTSYELILRDGVVLSENIVKGENTEVLNLRKQIGKMNEATTQVDSFVRLAPSGLFSGIVLPHMTSWRYLKIMGISI